MLIALFICVALGIAIGSYLTLVRSQARNVARSQDWNRALGVAEAGVEEALAQLNPGVTTVKVDLTANGWGSASGGFYGPKSRTLGVDDYSVVYTTDSSPLIYSTGQVSSAGSELTRVLQVQTSITPLFTVAMGAKLAIDMSGNSLATDSFDSGDTNRSSNGLYNSGKAGTNGDIASIAGVINIGNHTINGDVYLGPTATFQTGGTVTGKINHDFNVDFPDVVLPAPVTSFLTASATSTKIGGVTYTYCFTNSNSYVLPGGGSIYVAPGAKVTLYTASDISSIYVAGTAANAGTLQVYLAASSFTLSGNATAEAPAAANLSIWGLPSCKNITFSGNGSFTGTLYAPEAALTLNGGGSGNQDFSGSCIVNSVTVHGHFQFHYDEALGRLGAARGFVAKSWREL
ncbi:MAG TPA: collagen-binding domain-containing protein [Verrucomicrobiae bacterium]|nr:collagen-binding domain-containing protein [Verrucomicrobiae bacterium]